MFCNKCGAQIPDDSEVCPSCGKQLNIQWNQNQEPYYQQPYEQQSGQYYQQPYQPMPQPMRWFKFLIYFALFAGAVINLGSGISMITGTYYGEEWLKDTVYGMVPELETVDMIFGIAVLLLAGLGIVTRFALAGYRAIGPKLLIALYLSTMVINVANLIATHILIIGVVTISNSINSVVTQILVSGIMIYANHVYFKNRAHLFTR